MSTRVSRPDVLSLRMHNRQIRIYETPGKIAKCYWVANRPYEYALLRHIKAMRYRGTALDVGANIGNHSLWFAVMCQLKVLAFEPILVNELRANVLLNRLGDRITIFPYALGDAEGKAAATGNNRLHPDTNGSFAVRVFDHENISAKNVSVIKLDVEGMEAPALRGMKHFLKDHHPDIYAEEWKSEDNHWHNQIAEVLAPLGYQMTRRFSGKESATPVGKWEYRGTA